MSDWLPIREARKLDRVLVWFEGDSHVCLIDRAGWPITEHTEVTLYDAEWFMSLPDGPDGKIVERG